MNKKLGGEVVTDIGKAQGKVKGRWFLQACHLASLRGLMLYPTFSQLSVSWSSGAARQNTRSGTKASGFGRQSSSCVSFVAVRHLGPSTCSSCHLIMYV
jgi:hypothetical protein